jgi:hypothetical protein
MSSCAALAMRASPDLGPVKSATGAFDGEPRANPRRTAQQVGQALLVAHSDSDPHQRPRDRTQAETAQQTTPFGNKATARRAIVKLGGRHDDR